MRLESTLLGDGAISGCVVGDNDLGRIFPHCLLQAAEAA